MYDAFIGTIQKTQICQDRKYISGCLELGVRMGSDS